MCDILLLVWRPYRPFQRLGLYVLYTGLCPVLVYVGLTGLGLLYAAWLVKTPNNKRPVIALFFSLTQWLLCNWLIHCSFFFNVPWNQNSYSKKEIPAIQPVK